MMKLIGSNPWRISRVFRAVLYSAGASPPKNGTLYQKISSHGDPNTSITPLLEQWVEEGGDFKPAEVFRIIKQLRSYRRYSHALQMQEWLNEKTKTELTAGGMAIHLDLISKVRGLDKAEEYFNNIPATSRNHKVHGALLSCYVEKRTVEKAEELFKKMKDLGFANAALTYNIMLRLYSKEGCQEKLDSLNKEMQEAGVVGDSYTLCTQLNTHADSNIDEMDKLMTKMEADGVELGFHEYLIAAKGYLKANVNEKVLSMLTKAENTIKSHEKRVCYEHLITLYASLGDKGHVNRLWRLYKKGRVFSTGYLTVISSLVRLRDIEGAEKIFEEWITGPTGYDGRIVNLLISAYCKKRQIDKALALVERLVVMGHTLESGMWQCVANGCCLSGEVAKAVEPMKEAIRSSRGKLNRYTLAECLEHMKKEGDVEGAREMVTLLRESRSFPGDFCDGLEDFVNGDGKSRALAVMGEEKLKKKDDRPIVGELSF